MQLRKRLKEFNCCKWIVSAVIMFAYGASTGAAKECQLEPSTWASMDIKEIVLLNDVGEEIVVNSRIADEFHERTAGFQHICPEVIAKEFILFVFKSPTVSQFHMSNVHAPLDIAFVAADGTVVSVQTMFPYRDNSPQLLYGPREPFLYALEAHEGYFTEVGISELKSRLKLK